jgi:hypothetical protein
VEYRPIQTETWVGGVGYGFYQSLHRTLHGFDVENYTPSVLLQRQIGMFQARVQYSYDHIQIG